MSGALSIIGRAHQRLVHQRRVRRLAAAIAPLLDGCRRVLDVGCGDGRLAALLAEQRDGLSVEGYDVLPRPGAAITVHAFDGLRLPPPDRSTDAVLLVDVLHHTDDPAALLREAARVARRAVIVKDHRLARPLSGTTLRLMDWVGNRAHGVSLPYNYWPADRWRATWDALGLTVEHYQTRLDLYPLPLALFFERGLHFLARLRPGTPP